MVVRTSKLRPRLGVPGAVVVVVALRLTSAFVSPSHSACPTQRPPISFSITNQIWSPNTLVSQMKDGPSPNPQRQTTLDAIRDDEADRDPTEGEEGSSLSSFNPRPPDIMPRAVQLAREYEDLRDESDKTALNIDMLQKRVGDLQSQLADKQNELNTNREDWETEKEDLLNKISLMVGMVEESNQYAERVAMDEEDRYRKEKLESEVALLQSQIVQVQMALRREQKASEAMRTRLQDIEDAMEFEQMEFDKEKQKLQKQLEEEKKRLEAIQKAWDKDQALFTQSKREIEEQLREENKRLSEAQVAWAKNQIEYEKQQDELSAMLEEQRQRLVSTEASLRSERVGFAEEKARLQAMLDADRKKLAEIEQQLAKDQKFFQESQTKLEDQIMSEQDKVQGLYDRLQFEQEQFEKQRRNLEAALSVERQRAISVEYDLEAERQAFEDERTRLKLQIQQQSLEHRQSKEQMAMRYQAIRTQMTSLWEGAKRDSREERRRLTARYESKLATMASAVETLEKNLGTARRASQELSVVLRDLESTKDSAREETQMVEKRYISMIAKRNREISELKSSVMYLKSTVQSKQAQLEKYETSFRELIKLGAKIAGNKLKSGRNLVAGWLGKDNADIKKDNQ